ncbi:MAG TPA: RNA polymerase sigma factor [Patescibacteria group bacterium]
MSALKRFQKFLVAPAEWILIHEAKLGDKEAFGRLYKIYVDKIYRFVFFRVGRKREITEDIVSDIFLKAWEKLDTFKKGNFQAWVYMIARNKVIDHYRQNREHVSLNEEITEEKINLEDDVLNKLEVERIKDAIKNLTEDQQEVIILKFIEDVSNSEIANIMGKREDAVRALSSRGIKELRKLLNSERM